MIFPVLLKVKRDTLRILQLNKTIMGKPAERPGHKARGPCKWQPAAGIFRADPYSGLFFA